VTVHFRGSKLGPVTRFVKPGDIFSLSRITKAANRAAPPPARTATGKIIAPPPGSEPPAALTPAVHSFTLLRVTALQPDGSAQCSVIRSPNFKATLPGGPAVMGYRCLKLSTVTSPIAVKVVSGSQSTSSSSSSANVRATSTGFSAKEDARDLLDFIDGLYRSRPDRPLANLACITITLGKTKAEYFPVPVLGPEPIVLRFELSPEAEARAVFERSLIALTTRAADARIAQKAAFDDVGKLIVARKNKEAKDRAGAAFEAANAADQVLSEELEELKTKDKELKVPGAANFFANVDQQLKSLRNNNTQLAGTLRDLEKIVEKEKSDPVVGTEVQAKTLSLRIDLLLASGEVEEALAAYDQLATLAPNDPTIKARKEKLAVEWKPKSPEHEKAREYMLKTWPAVATIADLKESLPQLRSAVDTCKKAGDRHAFRRLLGILGGFPAKLTDLIKDLDPNSDADRKTLGDAKVIRDVVGKVEQDVVEYLKKE
jgi:tetratricopeptide (TPR) repeat protein